MALDSSRAADPDLGAILALLRTRMAACRIRGSFGRRQRPATRNCGCSDEANQETYRLSVRRLWIADDHRQRAVRRVKVVRQSGLGGRKGVRQ